MPTTCDIIFENPERVFYAGQLLRGNVRLTLTKEHKVRGVYIQIFGRAYAYWTEYCHTDHNRHRNNSTNRSSSGHHVSYTGEEDYLDENTYFVGGRNAADSRLPPGTHTYDFQCMLPAGLPTSVEHEVGHISYGARVVMDIPLWVDTEFKEHFTVIKPINLNADPLFRSPAMNKEERVFYPLGCFCCFPSGPLLVDAYAPVQGYTPGQTINVTVKVNNESNEILSHFDVELIKAITFHGSGSHDGRHEYKTKVIDHVITSEETAGCDVLQNKNFNVDLRVPSIPPTDFSTSSVVHVKYLIRITGSINACCRDNVVLDLPVTIGTYPIEDFDVNLYPETVIMSQPTAPQMPMEVPIPMPMPNEPAPPYPSAPTFPIATNMPNAPIAPSAPYIPPGDEPPSYEEAMGLSAGGNNANNFKPKYPMFRRQTSYSIDTN